MKNPKVSVVVGAYNEQDTIPATIQSILGQSLDDYEIIVVDDGSTDATPDIVQSFADPRVRLLRLENNSGLPHALNKGIEFSEGEYIARADADEQSLPFRLKKQLDLIESVNDAKVVGCWYRITGRANERIVNVKPNPKKKYNLQELMKEPPDIAHGSVLMKKNALESVGRYREEFILAQDYDLWLRMAEVFGGNWLQIVPEILYERKINANQISKRPLQRAYSRSARKCSESREKQGNDISELRKVAKIREHQETISLSKRESEGMYHYLAGTKLLQNGQDIDAICRFLRSIYYAPLKIRPWYKLFLSLMPNHHQSRVRSTVQRLVGSSIA